MEIFGNLVEKLDEMFINAANEKILFKNYKQCDTKKYGK